MDAVSVIRVLARRWWLTLPLVAALGATVLVYRSSVETVYASNAALVVHGPSVSRTDAGLRPSNPLLTGEPKGTVIVLAAVVDSASYHKALLNQGYAAYTVESVVSSRFAVRATSTDPALAHRTAKHVLAVFTARLASLQTSLGAPRQEFLQTREVLAATEPLPQPGTAFKTSVLLVAGGLLLIVSLVVIVDVALRTMAGRRAGKHDVPPAAPPLRTQSTGWPAEVAPSNGHLVASSSPIFVP